MFEIAHGEPLSTKVLLVDAVAPMLRGCYRVDPELNTENFRASLLLSTRKLLHLKNIDFQTSTSQKRLKHPQ